MVGFAFGTIMNRCFRQTLTFLFAASFLAQTTLMGVLHVHFGHDCATHSHTSAEPADSKATCWRLPEDQHGVCCPCGTGHVSTHGQHEGDDSKREPPTPHDHDNCSICQVLAQRLIAVEYVIVPEVGERLELVNVSPAVCYTASPQLLRYSRGPPAGTC